MRFRPKSLPIGDLRPAKDSAEHAGHAGANRFLNRALLRRFALRSTDLTFRIVLRVSARKGLKQLYYDPKTVRKRRARAGQPPGAKKKRSRSSRLIFVLIVNYSPAAAQASFCQLNGSVSSRQARVLGRYGCTAFVRVLVLVLVPVLVLVLVPVLILMLILKFI